LDFSGGTVVKANYMGDTGMHVAKWLWCYKKYHSKEKLKEDPAWIASIYVDAVKRLSANEKLQEEVKELNRKLGAGEDKSLIELWKKTRKMSIDAFDQIYSQLNTKFDFCFFEGEMEKPSLAIVDTLLKKKIATVSDEAVIVDLKKYNLGVWVLVRKDGTPLYSAKDVALAEMKFNRYKIEKSIYVVGAAQTLHLQQLFKTLELMGFKHAKDCIHIPFTEVRLPGKKMSSRTGENVLYSDFIEELMKHAKKNIKQREPKISATELEKRALKISVAAIKYSFLKQNPNRLMTFNPKEAINFEGDTGPYLLYSYARASSILKKVKNRKFKDENFEELEEQEIELVKKLSQFPEVVISSFKTMNPSPIATYAYQLAQIFNEFYHACPVIGSEKEIFRIELVRCFRQVLKNALNLLGIEEIERM
jgi:arginyl-tRNA synthetase